MKIKFTDLKNQISEVTGLLFTHPEIQKKEATEIWIKFRQYGYYVYINFEQPIADILNTEKLVGSGNSLNCNEYKKDKELIQHIRTSDIKHILEISKNYRGNISETVQKTSELFENIKTQNLY